MLIYTQILPGRLAPNAEGDLLIRSTTHAPRAAQHCAVPIRLDAIDPTRLDFKVAINFIKVVCFSCAVPS